MKRYKTVLVEFENKIRPPVAVIATNFGLVIEFNEYEHQMLVSVMSMQSGDSTATITDIRVDSPIKSMSFGCSSKSIAYWVAWYMQQILHDSSGSDLKQLYAVVDHWCTKFELPDSPHQVIR